MKIGVDLSPLQTGSRMRGIGYSLMSILNNLDSQAKQAHSFVFYIDKHLASPLDLIDVSGMTYSVEYLDAFKPMKNWPGQLRIISKLFNKLRRGMHQWAGSKRFKNVKGVDVFLQVDQAAGLPAKHRVKSVLLIFDVIPYVMEKEYLWSYATARQRGLSRKGAIGSSLARFTYYLKIKFVVRRAHTLLASSEWTKKDYISRFNVKPKRIVVCQLGVSRQSSHTKTKGLPKFEKSIPSPWGYLPEVVNLTEKPFLLFIGGADPRRRLIELVAAYNNLKAQNHDIRLVFTGDSMQNPDTIANPVLQNYIRNYTSYTEDLVFLGFVSDEQREWLYSNALAFVFPSVYEGFGLPILEAMQNGCPVISYLNTSIIEVAGDAVLSASNYQDIMRNTLSLIDDSAMRQGLIARGKKKAAMFAWSKTSKEVVEHLGNCV